VTVRPEGTVEIGIGTLSTGQGHETSYAQLLADWLGVDNDCIRLVTGDSDRTKFGAGSHSGRSIRLASITMHAASRQIIEKGLRIAAHLLEKPKPISALPTADLPSRHRSCGRPVRGRRRRRARPSPAR
jgi:carbon-monoxide dehydrogenase large subunit